MSKKASKRINVAKGQPRIKNVTNLSESQKWPNAMQKLKEAK